MDGAGLRIWINLIHFLVDYRIVICFFSRVPCRGERSPSQRYLGLVCLAGISVLYFQPQWAIEAAGVQSFSNFAVQLLRVLFYMACVSLYLYFRKNIPWSGCVYYSGFYLPFYTAVRCVFIILSHIFNGVVLGNDVLTRLTVTALVLLCEIGMCTLAVRTIPLEKVQTISPARYALILSANLILVYTKYTLITFSGPAYSPMEWHNVILYTVCAVGSLLAFLIMFENLQAAEIAQRKLELDQLTTEYELKNARLSLQNSRYVRQLYHDMRNHLLAVQLMTQDDEGVRDYIEPLLSKLSAYDTNIKTGLEYMDAFLQEKAARAQSRDIRCNLCLDLSPLGYVEKSDLISIFGNALDNAIEASETVEPQEAREIFIKSSRFANMILLRFENAFTGELKIGADGLLTRKSDAEYHGLGLKSMRNAVARYDGSIEISASERPSRFILTIMLPVRSKEECLP